MKIGITQRIIYHNGIGYDALDPQFYTLFSGHTLIPIPNLTTNNHAKIVDEIDMLVISGGDSSKTRVANETRLILRATMNKKPVLGICHGAFLLTQMLGGIVDDTDNHYNTTHLVKYNTFNTVYNVNSYHNSRILFAPEDAKVLAVCSDNSIECWIVDNIAAVVWHPERYTEGEKTFLPVEVSELYEESIVPSLPASERSLAI